MGPCKKCGSWHPCSCNNATVGAVPGPIQVVDERATLRDQFAMAALTGFQTFVRGGWAGTFPDDLADHVASNCYALADSMLRARQQKREE